MALSNKIVSPTGHYRIDNASTMYGTVKASPGFLHNVVIGNVFVAGGLEIYDDTAAATGMIGTLDLATRAAGAQVPMNIIFDVNFGTALTYALKSSIGAVISYN